MKVCQVTSVHGRYDSRIFQKIATSLANNGYDTYLLCLDNNPDEEKNGVKIVSAPFNHAGRIGRILKSGKALYKKALEIDADVYHLHDPELLKLGLKLKKKGKKIIFDSHEDIPMQILAKDYIPLFLRKTISKIFKKIQNKALKKYDGVLTATPLIAEKLKASNLNSVVISNFVVIEDYLDFNKSDRDYNRVCYVGGINSSRGVDNIVKATKNEDYYVEIVGDNSPGIQKLIGYDNSCSNITLLGYLSKNDVLEVYKKSCIGLCVLHDTPNHRNAYPIKIFEYMAAGLAVICSDFPEYKKIVEGNNCGICIEPQNSKLLKETLLYLISNPNIIKDMGDNGQKAVKEKYNWTSQEAILLDFYKKLER